MSRIITDYGIDEDFEIDDPGNVLRDKLSDISLGSEGLRMFDELLYTASERNIIETMPNEEDIETIFRLMVLITDIKNDSELEKYRM